jgi:hypothetical protein
LKEEARIIPRTMEIFAVPIESKDDYDMVDEWSQYYYSLDFSPLHTLAASNLLWIDLKRKMFLSEPASLALIALAQVAVGDLSGVASFVVQREGTVHGFGGWFAAELVAGINLSTGPPSKTSSWSNTFLPLESPLEVKPGDRLDLSISTSHNAARWQWQITLHPLVVAAQVEPAGIILPAQTTQAGELSALTATEDLNLIPVRNTNGEIDLFILQRIDGMLSITEIARQTEDRFPDKFSSYENLLERIYKLVAQYAGVA